MKKRAERRDGGRRPQKLIAAELMARRQAANHFRGDPAHQILAAEPLAPFAQLSRQIFERLTGEPYTDRRTRVYAAANGLETARERNRPVLLVLYKGRGSLTLPAIVAYLRHYANMASCPFWINQEVCM